MADLFELLIALNPWQSGRDFDTSVRRSGKTTLLYQTIHSLIDEQGVDPRSILFVNCDEPALAPATPPAAFSMIRQEKCERSHTSGHADESHQPVRFGCGRH